MTAYVAQLTQDAALGRQAWDMLRASLRNRDGAPRYPDKPTLIDSPSVPFALRETAPLDTPGAAQWALSIIMGTELVREFYTPPAPPANTPTP